MVKFVGVVGCGRMGSRIAKLFASKYHVLIFDNDATKLEGIGFCSNLLTTSSINELKDCDFIIECVFEDKALKSKVLGEVAAVSKTAIIASNTSSLSINQLSTSVICPERFVGLHFMNPPEKIELVEIIRCDATGQAVFDDCVALCESLGKITVECRDVPGFILNRILITMLNEALILLEEGVATAGDIDKAMMLGANHPIGPIALIDMIGLDIVREVMVNFNKAFGEKYSYAKILDSYIERGFLGKKVGHGFYEYS